MTMLTSKQPVHYGYKPTHDLPTPPSTSRLSPPLAYQEHHPRLPSIPRSHSPLDQQMSAPHRGLPLPAAMTLPPQQPPYPGNAPPPPPPPGPPAAVAHGHTLGQLPGPPPQWQGAEDSMKSWLQAKAEEERRKQEEERTKQESYRLEQRKLEAEMLRTSLDRGIPPPIVPLVFAGMGGALSDTALEVAKQYLAGQAAGQHPQLMSSHGQRSPEQRRDSQSQGYPPYAPVPSTPVSAAPQGYITYPGSPTTRGRAHTMSSTGSTGRPLGATSSSRLPSLSTSVPQQGPGQATSHQQHMGQAPQQSQQQPSTAQPESQASPGIFFHHWQPPTSHAGGSNPTATPSVGESPRNKRKATGPQEPAPAPSQQRFRSPPHLESGPSTRNPSPVRRRGHSRQRSDLSSYRTHTGRGRGESAGPMRAMSPLASGSGASLQQQQQQLQQTRSGGGHSVSSLLSEDLPHGLPYSGVSSGDAR